MLARLAEDLYWAGRYLERLQHTSRVLDVSTDNALASPLIDQAEIWQRAFATLVLERAYRGRHETVDGASVAAFFVLDTTNPGSIASLIRTLRENIRRARELVSSELWEAVNDLYLGFAATNVQRDLDEHPAQLYSFVKSSAHAVIGVAAETMPRDEAACFFEIGMHMERAGTTTRVLGTQAAAPEIVESTGLEAWAPVLRICAAREAFVRSGRAARADAVVNLLMFSSVFPRSVRYSVMIADDHAASLLRGGDRSTEVVAPDTRPLVARLLGRLRSRLDFGDAVEVLDTGLAETAASVETDLRLIHQSIAARFFHHSPGGELQFQEVRALYGDRETLRP